MVSQKNIGRMLHMTMKAMVGQLGLHFEEANISINVEHYLILRIVSTSEQLIQQDLASILQKDKSAVLRNINQLQHRKLLARIADSNDKRRNIVVITKQGLEMLEVAGKVHKKAQDKLLNGVSEEQLSNFINVLETIQQNGDK
jgi:DNA-binding MarR family transcriptional regulator